MKTLASMLILVALSLVISSAFADQVHRRQGIRGRRNGKGRKATVNDHGDQRLGGVGGRLRRLEVQTPPRDESYGG